MCKKHCTTCARCQRVDEDGYIRCPQYPSRALAQRAGMNVLLEDTCYCSEFRSKEGRGIEWSYSKAAYILDVAEVILPMCALVRGASIWERDELVQAVFSGEPLTWPKVTKRGLQGLFKALYLDGVDSNTLRRVWADRYA